MVRCHLDVSIDGDHSDIEDALSRAGVELCDGVVGSPALVLVDGRGGSGELACLEAARRRAPGRVLAVVTPGAETSPQAAWRVLEHGAADVVRWRGEDAAVDVRARLERWAEVDAALAELTADGWLLGTSPRWRSALSQVVEAARFTTAPVLLIGESGTGKELLARTIHDLDPRSVGAFVVVDCTTVVPTLSGSEFFGHERGAFTGAVGARDGAFALADGGTLFLDEVGELPLQLQAELLRVVQEGTFKRVGSNVWQRTSFRLVCATNRDLDAETDHGAFRKDLYFRIAGAIVKLPPLRERTEDVLLLFRAFLRSHLGRLPDVEPAVVDLLLARSWPGNVRELRQLAGRVANRHVGTGPVSAGDVPDDERPEVGGERGWPEVAFQADVRRAFTLGLGLREITQLAAEVAVRTALVASDGHVATAARLLGVTDRALQLRLRDGGSRS